MESAAEILVTNPDELAKCCAHLSECTRFGLDTEFVGETSYHPELCLIQVATEKTLYLIDPFAIGSLDDFWRFVVEPSHCVVVHAGREEVRLCHRAFGKAPTRLFDLQIAAGLVGMVYPLGHASLVSHLLGKKLSKSETLTEWRTRPLTALQIRYAFDDVRYLLPMQDRLQDRLAKLDRMEWAEEEFARLTTNATPTEPTAENMSEKWRKVRGAGSLDRRRLAVLRELHLWREQQAIKANRPARTIVRDDLLVEIARRFVRQPKDLTVVRGLAHRFADEIFLAIERAHALPADELPDVAEREQDAQPVVLASNIVQATLVDYCAKKRIASNLVASGQDIKALVRAFYQKEPPPSDTLLCQGWRATHVLPHLQAILEGRRAVRIADLHRDAPFDYIDVSEPDA